MRTKTEITDEKHRVAKLIPCGPHVLATRRAISYVLEEMEWGVDDTAEEWSEMTYDQQQAVNDTRRWVRGETDKRPSDSFAGLVK